MEKLAQRIAIAETQGARIASKGFPVRSGTALGHRWQWADGTSCGHPGGGLYGWGWSAKASVSELPDYLNDRNAMIAAVLTLNDGQRRDFVYALSYEVGDVGCDWDSREVFTFITAPLDKIAKAYLVATSKWRND